MGLRERNTNSHRFKIQGLRDQALMNKGTLPLTNYDFEYNIQ